MLEGTQSAFTSLFDNSVLHQIERMRLRPQRRLTNRGAGRAFVGEGWQQYGLRGFPGLCGG